MPRRPILLALLVAGIATLGFIWVVKSGQGTGGPHAVVGDKAPPVVGTTLDGSTFDLSTFAGKPVVVNFWGPSCVPCRDEFPLLESKVKEHAADGLTVVGVLTDDPVDPAREFVVRLRRDLADGDRSGQVDQGRLPRRGAAADLFRRRFGGHPGHPGR